MPSAVRSRGEGGFGDGLLTLSRFPAVSAGSQAYLHRPTRYFVDGEALARKGWTLARLTTPAGELDVYNTHLTARYSFASFETVRLAQAVELAEAVLSRSAGRPFILLGDLNMLPDYEGASALRDLLGLRDLCLDGGADACGDTAPEGRIDHVWVPASWKGIRIARSLRGSADRTPGGLAYSDHCALEAEVEVPAAAPAAPLVRRLEALDRLDAALRAAARDPKWGETAASALARIPKLRASLGTIETRR